MPQSLVLLRIFLLPPTKRKGCGPRLCRRPAAADPKGQRLGPSRAPALSYPLRLVFDTAAVRSLCEDARGVLRAGISKMLSDFGFRHWSFVIGAVLAFHLQPYSYLHYLQ